MSGLAPPVQRTWSVGEIVTSTMENANIRDAVNFLLGAPVFVGHQATPQSIPNSTATAVALDTNIIDNYGGHSTITNNSRYTAQQAGLYIGVGSAEWASGTGQKSCEFRVNGSVPAADFQAALSNTSGPFGQPLTVAPFTMAIGDYVELISFQGSGGAVNLAAAGAFVWWIHS